MKANKITTAMLGLLLALPLTGVEAAREESYVSRAKVVEAQPIYKKTTETEVYCLPKQHARRDRRGDGSYTNELVGAVVGGAIGNQFGGGSGKDALTIAGAVVGASVAHDVERQGQRHRPTANKRCKVVEQATTSKEIAGYRVKYRYDGQIFSTLTRRHPGEWIQVEVTLNPKPNRTGRF